MIGAVDRQDLDHVVDQLEEQSGDRDVEEELEVHSCAPHARGGRTAVGAGDGLAAHRRRRREPRFIRKTQRTMRSAARKKRMTPCRMSIIWTGMPALICISGAPARIAPRSRPPNRMPERVGAAQERHGDGVEADVRGVRGRQVVLHARGSPRRRRARRACRPAAIVSDDDESGPHARIAGRVGVGAHGADLEAERRAVQHPPDDGHGQRAPGGRRHAAGGRCGPAGPGWPRSPTSSVRANGRPGARSGPLTAQEMIEMATKLSMMVMTTSWAPV